LDSVTPIESASDAAPPLASDDRGWCLCLSGGGFRATLFHLGALIRLNELGVLSRLSTITSVSGGSILNGLLACRWSKLQLNEAGILRDFEEIVARPMREFCAQDLRTPLLLGTRLMPLNWPTLIRDRCSVSANFLAKKYEPLYGLSLGDLPQPGARSPRFVFCATNVSAGACWHFHGGPSARMDDFYRGYCEAQDVRVSEAVAASSAFPPGFSALRLAVRKDAKFTRDDPWGETRVESGKRPAGIVIGRSDILLTDGGVYDNLAVEPVWRTYKTLLVSDAGQPFESVENSGQGIIRRLKRAADISIEQVGAVRKRWLVEEFLAGRRSGALWTIHSRLADFALSDGQGFREADCKLIQKIRTDLDAFSEPEIACLENHGYSLADAAMRSRAAALCSHPVGTFRWPHGEWAGQANLAEVLEGSSKRKIFRDAVRYLGSSFSRRQVGSTKG
jgi:NTE family protein